MTLKPLVIANGQVKQLTNDTLNCVAIHPQTLTSLIIPNGFNAVLAAPITIAPNSNFTIAPGSRAVII